MKNILVLFFHEIRLLSRDRHALVLLFAMPLALIVFLSLALKDVYLSKVASIQELYVVAKNCEKDSMCFDLVKNLERFSYRISINKEMPVEKLPLTLVLPINVDATLEHVQSGEALTGEDQIQIIFDPILDQALRALVRSHVYLSLQSIVIGQIQKEMSKESPQGQENKQMPDVSKFEGLVVEKAYSGLVLPNPVQQSVPAWALFGMFFIVIPLTNSMIRDRQLGVFKRLLSFPVSRTDLMVGKILPYLFINLFQFAMMFSIGISVLPQLMGIPTDYTFDYAGIALVTLACSLAATSYGMMISCFARTSEQAHAFGAMSVVVLSIIGGVMIPRFVMPDFMQNVAMISPLYWGLESYVDLIVRKAALRDVLPKVSVLIIFAALAALISRFKFKWSEVS
jgi:ABC-2 type transport system permease protein